MLRIELSAVGDDGARRIARRAAAASAVLTIVFLATLGVTPLLAPLPVEWRGAADYARTFTTAAMISLIPPLALAPVFVLLAASLRELGRPGTAAVTTAGLAFAASYATIISANDLIQLTTVRASLERGAFDGLDPFVWTNPYGLFAPLELLGYFFQALAGLAFVPLFAGDGRLDTWIRRLLLTNTAIGVASFGIVVFDVPWLIFPGLVLWSVVFAAAMALLARRLERSLD